MLTREVGAPCDNSPHVSTDEDELLGHFVSVDEEIPKLRLELYTSLVVRELGAHTALPFSFFTLFDEVDGLQKNRAGEEVRCSNTPLCGDPLQSTKIHRKKAFP
jgi:hypothetical protein